MFDEQLAQMLRALREYWWVVALPVIVLALVALLRASREDPRYEASARLVYVSSDSSDALLGTVSLPEEAWRAEDPTVALNTLAELATTARVRRRAEERTGRITETVSVAKFSGTNILDLKVVGPDPTRAAQVANAWSEAFARERYEASRSGVREAMADVRSRLEELKGPRTAAVERQLETRLADLRAVLALRHGDLRIAKPAPAEGAKVSPDRKSDVLLGGLAGLLLGLTLVAIIGTLDRRMKTIEEVELAWNAPLLASIPRCAQATEAVGPEIHDPATAEAFRHLKANLSFVHTDETKAVAITSAVDHEGKTAVALGLALTLAAAGERVLLIDADFQGHDLTDRLNLGPEGLSNALAGPSALEDVTRKIEFDESKTHGHGKTHALSAVAVGSTPPNPELLSGDQLVSLVRSAAVRYDHVLMDCGPLLPVSDTIPIAAASDGVLIAQRLNYSRSDAVHVAAELVSRTRRPILGLVVAAPKRSFANGYGFTNRMRS